MTVTTIGIILHGSRILVPKSLQQLAIDIAYEGHLGISKTKALLREKIWFPNIANMVKQTIDGCIPCQAVGKQTSQEPHRNAQGTMEDSTSSFLWTITFRRILVGSH